MGIEIGSISGQAEGTIKAHLHYPYCLHDADASEMLTQEAVTYLHRFIMREHVLPMMNNMFSGLEDVGSRSGDPGLVAVKGDSISQSRRAREDRQESGSLSRKAANRDDRKIRKCCGKNLHRAWQIPGMEGAQGIQPPLDLPAFLKRKARGMPKKAT